MAYVSDDRVLVAPDGALHFLNTADGVMESSRVYNEIFAGSIRVQEASAGSERACMVAIDQEHRWETSLVFSGVWPVNAARARSVFHL